MGNSAFYRQLLVTVIANISSIGFGLVTGWSSPNVVKLQDDELGDTPLDRVITAREVGWIGSLLPIGGAISPIFAGTIARKYGRKISLLSTAACLVVAYLVLAIGSSIEWIYTARLLHGVCIGMIMTVLPIYISEITQDEYRGLLGILLVPFVNVGILFSFCVGPFVPYRTFQYVCTIFPVSFLVIFAFIPDSPVYYLAKHDRERAVKSLAFLRGASRSDVLPELDIMQRTIDHCEEIKKTSSWLHLFTDRGNLRGLTICCGLIWAQQFSGINAVLYYAQSIFQRAGGDLKPEISSIITMGVPGILCWVAPLAIVRFSRRTNLMASVVGMGTMAMLLSIYFILDEYDRSLADTIAFLPIASLIVYLVLYNVGIGPIPFVLVGEIFASNMKTYGMIIVSTLSSVFGAIILLFFETLNDSVGPEWVFAIFAMCMVIGAIFIYFYVVETRGLSLLEIQDRLNRS